MRLDAPLRSVRRRLRLQAALDGGARAAVAAAALALVAVYGWRLHLLHARGLGIAGGLAVAVVAGGALAAALRRIPLDRAALSLDEAHGLHDRLRSALAFAAEPAPTPFMQAAIADAEAAAAQVEPRRAAPVRRPDALGPAATVLAVAGLVALLRFPTNSKYVATVPPPPHLVVDRTVLEPERAAVAELAQLAQAGGDEDTKQLADQLNKLLTQIDAQELTRQEAFDKLAQLENRYLKADAGQLDELKRRLRKAGSELGKSKLLAETGKALQADDPDKARHELEKLAAQAEQAASQSRADKRWDQQQREEMARALQNAARQQQDQAEEQKRQQEEQRLRDEERRLRKQLQDKPDDQELQRRLQRNQRDLQRLEREKQERAEQQRQLQRLQRELEKAAEQLRQKMSPEALQQLAQAMKQMEQEMTRLGNQSRAQLQVAEIKEVLRRMGRSSSGKGGQGQGQGQQQANAGPSQKGQGKQDKNAQRLREFDERAGGGKPDALLLGEHPGGQNQQQVLLPLPLGQGTNGPQPGQSGPRPGDELPGGGDGIGHEHDANLMGDATKLDGRRHDTRVDGTEGAGPSRSQTILGSAQQGFATAGYKRVYGDYTAVVEEVMSKERVPPGYRFYIKRYFQLIKPRE